VANSRATSRPSTGISTLTMMSTSTPLIDPRIVAETDDVGLVADLLGHGGWIALLPRSVAERAPGKLATVSLRRPAIQRRTVLAWHRRNASPTARAFVDLAAPATSKVSPDNPLAARIEAAQGG
jgi:DNA-binding transcriptional LysR family regulator